MKHILLILAYLFLIPLSHSQKLIIPDISARVDTSKVEVKAVYHLYKEYLNSRMDSVYQNPHWNKKQAELAVKLKASSVDRAITWLFWTDSIGKKHRWFNAPKVLQIDKIEENRYQIKTIFMNRCEKDDDKAFNPDCITKLYAVKDENGAFKLENVIDYDTRNWKKYKYKNINYVVQPFMKFNKRRAKEGVAFCNKIAKQFALKQLPFTYYMTSNPDEMIKLSNLDYLLSYTTGFTDLQTRTIFTSFSHESYPHEFVHMLFYNSTNKYAGTGFIGEGLATWLGGSGFNSTYEEGLKKFSLDIKDNNTIDLDKIISFEYRNPFDNDPFYLTGGVICSMVYEKYGASGIFELYNSPDMISLKKLLEKMFNMSYEEIDLKVIKYIKEYSVKK
ncbi:hypothetical protein AAGV28_13500 [Flavobacterium sp. FZUC8N2.13]|uniref:Peptidase MA superfamily protein n=1 Tax=Flavobacterium zubiriense TaxID=3138075 RepID=A0ABV4TE87_9FLAO